MTGNGFLQQLKSGKGLYGTAVVSSSPLWPRDVKTTGADFVFMDTEHIPCQIGNIYQQTYILIREVCCSKSSCALDWATMHHDQLERLWPHGYC